MLEPTLILIWHHIILIALYTYESLTWKGDLSGHRIALAQDEIIPENTELDFEAGIEAGVQETIEDVEQRLIDAGHDPEEVSELLYDPAPRRKGGGKKTRKTPSRSYRARSYDPAPRKRKITAKRTGKKGTLSKLKKFALPGAAGLTFYGAYVKRAEDLANAGKIPEKSVFKAIEYDVKNFNGTDAMNRVKTQAGEIATPLIASWAVKETHILGKYSGIAADLLAGFGVGIGAKAVLDPPINTGGSNGLISVKKTSSTEIQTHAAAPCPNCYQPYKPGGY